MKAENEKFNPFEMAKREIDIAAKYVNLESRLLEKLKHTERELIVHFPVKMDDGAVNAFTGYRVEHNVSR
jgi:glutamate dehydrogenase (NAD(P)+)